jgi:hypothetical protein
VNEYKLDPKRLVYDALTILQYHFRKTSTSESATCKLTAASCAIGKNVLLQKGVELGFRADVTIGDLIIEAFYECNYIKIVRAPTEAQIKWEANPIGKRPYSRAPYMIETSEKWLKIGSLPDQVVNELIQNTSFTKIKRVSKLFQDNGYPIIKHWGFDKDQDFKDLLDEPFVKAINKLQRTAWTVDKDILEAVKKNKKKFVTETLKVSDDTGKNYRYCIFGNNKELEGKDLYWNGIVFKPELGNKSLEKKYYGELRRLTNKLRNKPNKKPLERMQAKYDEAATHWNAKLVLLKNRSKFDAYNMTVQKAESLADKIFFQYVDADYRGRLYYRESYLNYQGKDIERGLLKFAEEKPMSEEGLFYFAVHTACSYNQSYSIDNIPEWCEADYKTHLESEGLTDISVDKMTIDDRVKWVLNNSDFIKNTWINRTIHVKAEKPVGFLACCKAWCALWETSSEEGVYLINLPIPIDGSNNGWQHLAAISKDKEAGALVGLVPTEIPKDFYVQTAKALIARMPDWFESRNMSIKDIRKGISKRGSMTRAYSAGHLAIALNMYADCYAEGFHSKYNITMSDCNDLSFNLIKAIDEVCPGPLETMSYLQAIASYIIGDLNEPVIEWTTPSGFPVRYENYVMEDIKWKSWISDMRIEHVGNEPRLVYGKRIPSPGGFASGISPNFIHSMDAAHMALIVSYWDSDFAAIHDSFSTHACEVGSLLSLTKEVFIKMYDHDDYYKEIADMMLIEPENFSFKYKLGNLDVKSIEDSNYFFA